MRQDVLQRQSSLTTATPENESIQAFNFWPWMRKLLGRP